MEQPSPSAKTTILLVDDDKNCRQLVSEILSMEGYTVIEADNGNDALKKFESHSGPIHLLFTDVVMPHMDGMTLAEALRKKIPTLKIIFTSGYSMDDTYRNHLNEEINFVEKPYDPAHLIEKVANVLKS